MLYFLGVRFFFYIEFINRIITLFDNDTVNTNQVYLIFKALCVALKLARPKIRKI
jgi:hypothetical protein